MIDAGCELGVAGYGMRVAGYRLRVAWNLKLVEDPDFGGADT